MKIFSRLYNKLFYDPYKIVKKNKNIIIDSKTLLLKSVSFIINKNNKINIAKDSMIACNFIFESNEGEINIGERTYIGSGTSLISKSKITIGNDVTIAWGCQIYDHNSHSLDWLERRKDILLQNEDYRNGLNFITHKDWSVVKTAPILICDKVWIGFDVTILAGVTIGEGAIIGAKSVVRKDVEPWSIVIGNPAVAVKYLPH
jgi:acetyltransferase-like isoleucine patch superfamily enzyme